MEKTCFIQAQRIVKIDRPHTIYRYSFSFFFYQYCTQTCAILSETVRRTRAFPSRQPLLACLVYSLRVLTSARRVCSLFNARGGVLIIMHGRSRMTIDPRIPTMPGRTREGGVGVNQIFLLSPLQSAIRCISVP